MLWLVPQVPGSGAARVLLSDGSSTLREDASTILHPPDVVAAQALLSDAYCWCQLLPSRLVETFRCMACCLWACKHKGHPGGRACQGRVWQHDHRKTFKELQFLRCQPTQWHCTMPSDAEHASHMAAPTLSPLHSQA